MVNTKINDVQNDKDLLNKAVNDKNSAVQLFKKHRNRMYKEAYLFIPDTDTAKAVAITAFRNAYPHLAEAKPDTLKQWLNEFIVDECINRITPLESSGIDSTAEIDETPDKSVVIPDDKEKIKVPLQSVLSSLTPSQRLVLILRYRYRMSFEQAARKCNAAVSDVKAVFSDALQAMRSRGIKTGIVFAYVNALYPYYIEPETEHINSNKSSLKQEIVQNAKKQPDDYFNTSVLELKDLFSTNTLTVNASTDNGIDDTDDIVRNTDNNEHELTKISYSFSGEYDAVPDTQLSTMPDTKSSNKDSKASRIKFIILIIAALILAFFAGIVCTRMLFGNSSSNQSVTEEPTPEEKAAESTEATEEPSEESDNSSNEKEQMTPEPNPVIGSAYIKVADLTIRKGPGIDYEQNGLADPETSFDVFETADGDGYIWYRIGDDKWVADYEGQYIDYSPNS